jgi:hypothetical protein
MFDDLTGNDKFWIVFIFVAVLLCIIYVFQDMIFG